MIKNGLSGRSLRNVVGSLTQDAGIIDGLKTVQDSGVGESGGQDEGLWLFWVGAELDRGKWQDSQGLVSDLGVWPSQEGRGGAGGGGLYRRRDNFSSAQGQDPWAAEARGVQGVCRIKSKGLHAHESPRTTQQGS